MITPNKFIPLSDSALGKIEITYNQIDGKNLLGKYMILTNQNTNH